MDERTDGRFAAPGIGPNRPARRTARRATQSAQMAKPLNRPYGVRAFNAPTALLGPFSAWAGGSRPLPWAVSPAAAGPARCTCPTGHAG